MFFNKKKKSKLALLGGTIDKIVTKFIIGGAVRDSFFKRKTVKDKIFDSIKYFYKPFGKFMDKTIGYIFRKK